MNLPILVFSEQKSRSIRGELDARFGRSMWHTFTICSREDGQKICYWCGAAETKRARVNIWGTICEVAACDRCHLVNDGIARDQL